MGIRQTRSRTAVVLALVILMVAAVPTLGAAGVNPATRTAVAGPLVVRWSASDPEAITYLSWNGSPNLTNSWVHPNCVNGGIHEFFGNSWGGGDAADFVSPVGWGTTGEWAQAGSAGVDISSAATGCYGTSGVKVTTTYGLLGTDAASTRLQVERRFAFGSNPFASDLRPYIPRLYPLDRFTDVLFPSSTGAALLTRRGADCGLGCKVIDWNGSWFALHDPVGGLGLIVRHVTSDRPVALWLDEDGGSYSTATSVVLLQTGEGLTGTVVDRQILCFYDRTTWTPSLTLPAGCSGGWIESRPVATSRLGLPAAPGTYSTATKTSSLGGYVTWRANLGTAAAGATVDVLFATRRADGTWGPFTRLTTRRADVLGVARFSWRQTSPRWVSVAFSLGSVRSTASQARWR